MITILLEHSEALLGGLIVTCQLMLFIIVIGIPLGLVLGIIAGRYSTLLSHVIHFLKFFTKVVPVLILLYWLHFPLQAVFKVVIDPFWTTVLALGFVNTVSIATTIQDELKLIPKPLSDAGKTLGLSQKQITKYIELPIVFRRAIPSALLTQASMLEYTLFASLIGVPELFRVAQLINSQIYDPIPTYSLLVLFFFAILAPLHLAIGILNKKYQYELFT